ncbi:hypothetical protein COCMIDRAFT_104100 [Bipolaris oryzae ATCC 44560]|uniref:Coenzyme Q-binding protein COQ10 START domain-containing protein n=1 Tax=Bipolaris oryzae ATCC 44560 TaxID=930090 RepID=W6YXF5_COCMI|nr:uncharacterized protein COCMIDRAFT_104100 [Bipolaris oryzae ATCC 44560]EUC42218.1 hypothetical protein COCMIDRAFT_104100 [Bipolaris oryzae ATCC 44560]
MPPLKLARPLLQPSSSHHHHLTTTQRRTFLPNPFSSLSPSPSTPQILTATRTLPYPPSPVYSIIADVPSYSSFLPYCAHSTVSKWSAPDRHYNRRWPSEGVITTGFGAITESFASRIYCVPGRWVESVGGEAETSLDAREVAHHFAQAGTEQRKGGTREGSNGLLTYLRSKWQVEPVREAHTRVSLVVEFSFANPMYAALSGGVAPKVAEYMVRAFETRVQEVLERNPEMVTASLGDMEGSAMRRK